MNRIFSYSLVILFFGTLGINNAYAFTPSANGTTIPTAAQITDSNGVVWTVSGGYAYQNGRTDNGGEGDTILLLYYNGLIYLDATGYGWWKYSGTWGVWTSVSGDPRPACGTANGTPVTSAPGSNLCSAGTASAVSGSGPWTWNCTGTTGALQCSAPVAFTSSPNGTTIPTATQITDSNGVVWTVSGGYAYQNGRTDNGGKGDTILLLYYNGLIYLDATGYGWWKYSGTWGVWTSVSGDPRPACGTANGTPVTSAPGSNLCSAGTASAVSGSGPWTWNCTGTTGALQCTAPVEIPVSPNGTTIPTATQIIDSKGVVWTVSGGYAYQNGKTDGGGGGVTLLLLYYNGLIYLDARGYGWWKYSGTWGVWTSVSGDPRPTSGMPSFTTQPANVTVTTPLTAIFTVVVTGLPTPAYQWQSEAPGATSYTAISGATGASYITPATTIAESGTNYECVATNSVGTVTSNAASLTVNPVAPIATIVSPADQSTFTTGSISITAIAQGSISNVSFYNGSTLLGTVTSTSQAFTYPWANVPAGTYNLTAVATSITGATGSSSPVTVTINSSPFTYAVDDNILTKTDALNHTTSFQYDNLNRLLKITFADTSTVSYAYDLFGNQISVTDQRGNTLTKTYDAYDRLSQTKDPNNGLTQFSYDTDSRLLQLTDADGHATSYTYDPNGKVLTQTNALNFTTAFTYDPVGNAATRTDANNKTTNYTYDVENHLTGITYPDNTSVANVYDALGRKTSMTDATGQTSYTYDALNRLLSKSAPGFNSTITYTYDGEGNRLTSVDQNNRTISNTYDTLNRLSSVQDPNGTTSYGYDAVSNEVSVASPNGVTENYTYDALNRLLSAVNRNASAGVISSFTNVYDIAGMITQKTYSDGSWDTYAYDALNQLLSETKQTSSSVVYGNVYSYDAVGNRLSLTKNTTLGEFWSVDSLTMPAQTLSNMTGAGYGSTANPNQAVSLARSYTNDNANRLTGWSYAVNVNASSFPVQTDTYTYDNNGNRLSKQAVLTGQTGTPQQTSYAYDFENRLNQLQYTNIPNITGTQTDSLFYNGEGLRTQAILNNITSAYFYDGMNILVERDGSGNTTQSYTRGLDFGGGINSLIAQNNVGTGAVQYYDYNDLGSVADLTTTTGTTAASYSYDAFGNLLTAQSANDTNRYLFSTKELDLRSGLEYFGARYYDPEIGRWLTLDPLAFVDKSSMITYIERAGIPFSNNQFINLYANTSNSPVNFVDPYGLYGTANCSYYEQQCKRYGGNYYCQDAPNACKWFNNNWSFLGPFPNPNPTDNGYEGWRRCTRQCLQDCDKESNQCDENKSFWTPQNTVCHAKCYLICTNEYTAPKGKDTPDW